MAKFNRYRGGFRPSPPRKYEPFPGFGNYTPQPGGGRQPFRMPKMPRVPWEKVAGITGRAASALYAAKELWDSGVKIYSDITKSEPGSSRRGPGGGRMLSVPATGGKSGLSTKTFFTSYIKGSRKPKALMAEKNYFKTTSNYRVTSISQQQATFDLQSSGTGLRYNDAIFAGKVNGDAANDTGFLALAFNTLKAPTFRPTSRVYYQGCDMVTTIANASNVTAFVTLYECVAKHDLQQTSELTGTSVYSPRQFWINGTDDTSNIQGAAPAATVSTTSPSAKFSDTLIEAKPTESQLFNVYWKVLKSMKVAIPPLGTHVHKSKYRKGVTLSYNRVENSAILQGITHNLMGSVYGVPGYNATDGTVVTSATQLLITHDITYVSYDTEDNFTSTYYANTVQDPNGDSITILGDADTIEEPVDTT
ncbi:MAG: putative capsid protein [Cressdnaviricota sp.]|nr:MAG: putative capsid protein [Cressdnaviricota sp.]